MDDFQLLVEHPCLSLISESFLSEVKTRKGGFIVLMPYEKPFGKIENFWEDTQNIIISPTWYGSPSFDQVKKDAPSFMVISLLFPYDPLLASLFQGPASLPPSLILVSTHSFINFKTCFPSKEHADFVILIQRILRLKGNRLATVF